MDQAVQHQRETTLRPNYVVVFDPSASIFVRQAGPGYLHQQMAAAFEDQPGIQAGLRVAPIGIGKKISCVFGLTGMGQIALEQAICENPERSDKKDFLARMLNRHFERVRKQGEGHARWAGDACKVHETAAKLDQPASISDLVPVSG